jgi:hypothetical protein
MLLRFGVKNHLSIRDYQELSCVASAGYEDLKHTLRADNLRQKEKEFLPVIAIYGANAAGKSNVLDALAFFREAISRSHLDWEQDGELPQKCFSLDSASCNAESLYDCDVVVDGTRYQYGFALTQKGVTKEWLYAYPKGTRNIMFQRDFSDNAEADLYFGPSLKKVTSVWKKISENRKLLMLSAAGRKEMEHDQLTPFWRYFREMVTAIGIVERGAEAVLAGQIQDETVRSRIVEALKVADFGIVGVEIDSVAIPEESLEFTRDLFEFINKKFDRPGKSEFIPPPDKEQQRIHFRHLGGDGQTYLVRYDEESTGTKYLMQLLVPVIAALEKGSVLIVDEITTNLHTKLSEKIVSLFSSTETNKNNAQFIFSTHDTNLLSRELLRRDEIWFAEKDSEGATDIYPLSDFKTRKSDNIERGYLQGRFGAIPFLGDIDTLFNKIDGQKTT